MKSRLRRWYVLAPILAIMTLACVAAERLGELLSEEDDDYDIYRAMGTHDAGPPAEIVVPQALRGAVQSCDAQDWLNVRPQLTRTKQWEDGSFTCDYEVAYTNSSNGQPIAVVVYVREEDGYAGVKKAGWELLARLASSKSWSFTGWVTTYTDPEAKGPTLLRVERFAAIYDVLWCQDYMSDEDYLNLVAKPIEEDPCPAPK